MYSYIYIYRERERYTYIYMYRERDIHIWKVWTIQNGELIRLSPFEVLEI